MCKNINSLLFLRKELYFIFISLNNYSFLLRFTKEKPLLKACDFCHISYIFNKFKFFYLTKYNLQKTI